MKYQDTTMDSEHESSTIHRTSTHKRTSISGKPERKQVAFDSNVIVRVHLHLNDMTDSEKKASWYHEDEISTIRAACCRELIMQNARKRFQRKDNNYTSMEDAVLACACRGLEYRTKEGSKLRLEHRLSAWEVVELEQARQWREGLHDDETMAEKYHECADESAQLAHLIALKDQQWVQEQRFCIAISVKPSKRNTQQRLVQNYVNKSHEQVRCSR
jgi:hypothetical protein